jgi:predicted PurR-regulated permease PerM
MENRLIDNETLRGLLAWSALLGAGWLAWQILSPFIVPLAWAGAIAFATHGPYRKLRARFRREGAATALMVLLVMFCVVLPAAIMAFWLGQEALSLYGVVEEALQGKGLAGAIAANRSVAQVLAFWQERIAPLAGGIDLAGSLADLGKAVAGGAVALSAAVVKNAALFIVQVFLMVFALAYAYPHGERCVAILSPLLPGDEVQRQEIITRLSVELRAIINGSILTCVAQGALAGVGFLICGIPSPVLLGCLSALAALIPVVGTALIWVPAAVYLLLGGAYIKAGILAVWGALVVGSADNVLRPFLIGNNSSLSGLLIAFGAMGGMAAFGLIGAVAGPFALAAIGIILGSWRDGLAQAP